MFWSGNNYALPQPPAPVSTKIVYWYDEEEKRGRRGNLRFIRRYFPQAHIQMIPEMAHAELVMVHPEAFCRYAREFLNEQKDNQQKKS